MADILVLSAHLPELSGLKSILGDGWTAEVSSFSVAAAPVGIGLVAAALGTASLVRTGEPRAAVFVGTCGAYPGSGLSIGQVIVATRVCLGSTAVAEGRAGFPGPMQLELVTSASIANAIAGEDLRRVAVATTLAVTTDDALAARIAERQQCAVEHLEAFAVAAACAEARVPIAVVLGVANGVGRGAREEWRAHHVAAGRAAGARVAEWIAAGAPGIRTAPPTPPPATR